MRFNFKIGFKNSVSLRKAAAVSIAVLCWSRAGVAETTYRTASEMFYGTADDQAAYHVVHDGPAWYVAGGETGRAEKALLLNFSLPLKAQPAQKWLWQSAPALSSGETLQALALSGQAVYAVGRSQERNGGSAPFLAKFSRTPDGRVGEEALWVTKPEPDKLFRVGAFQSVLARVEGGREVVYAAGRMSSADPNHTAVLAKYDAAGKLLWVKALSGDSKFARGGACAMLWLEDGILIAGYEALSKKSGEFKNKAAELRVWKVGADGNLAWTQTHADHKVFLDREAPVEARMAWALSEGTAYLAFTRHKSGRPNACVLKLEPAGGIGWSVTWSAEVPDGWTAKSFAGGVAEAGSDRLCLAGWVEKSPKDGGLIEEDGFVLELDKERGFVLSSQALGTEGRKERLYSAAEQGGRIVLAGWRSASAAKAARAAGEVWILTREKRPVKTITIKVLPPDPKKKQSIPVAIYSDEVFKAPSDLELGSLRFGSTGNEPSWDRCGMKDVNQDGLLDLLCTFDRTFKFQSRTYETLRAGQAEAVMKGETLAGEPLAAKALLPGAVAPEPPSVPVPSEAPSLLPALSTAPPAPEPLSEPAPILVPPPAGEPPPLESEPEEVSEAQPDSESESAAAPAAEEVQELPLTSAQVLASAPPPPASSGTTLFSEPLFTFAKPSAASSKTGSATQTAPPPAQTREQIIRQASQTQTLVSYETAQESQESGGSLYSREQDREDPAPYEDASSAKGLGLAQAYVDMGEDAVRAGKLDLGIEYFEEALKMEPQSFEAHRSLGLAYLRKGDAELARAHLHKAEALQPGDDAVVRALETITR